MQLVSGLWHADCGLRWQPAWRLGVASAAHLGPPPQRILFCGLHWRRHSWSTQQIEWFVGLWWKHLANASVATFHGSLEQFSAWAADAEGLECLIAWLKRTPEQGEDLLLLQLP